MISHDVGGRKGAGWVERCERLEGLGQGQRAGLYRIGKCKRWSTAEDARGAHAPALPLHANPVPPPPPRRPTCSIAVWGVLPHTPTVVQPVPFVVCSHCGVGGGARGRGRSWRGVV